MIHAFWLKDKVRSAGVCAEAELERTKIPAVEVIEAEAALDSEEFQLAQQWKEFNSNRLVPMAEILERIAEQDRQRIEAWEAQCTQLVTQWGHAHVGQVDAAFTGSGVLAGIREIQFPPKPQSHPLLSLPEAAQKALASVKQCSGTEITAKAFNAHAVEINAKLEAVKKQRKTITPAQWWAAAGLLFFNSSATAGYVDHLGRTTTNPEVTKWCEAAGCSEAYRDTWYRPSKVSQYATLSDWVNGVNRNAEQSRKVRRDALGRIWINGVEYMSQDMQERKALMAEADAQMAVNGK